MIPFDPSRPQSLTECIAGEPRLQKLINEDTRVKKLTDLSLKLEGLNRNVATHAAGVVIADKKLTEVVPLYIKVQLQLIFYQRLQHPQHELPHFCSNLQVLKKDQLIFLLWYLRLLVFEVLVLLLYILSNFVV